MIDSFEKKYKKNMFERKLNQLNNEICTDLNKSRPRTDHSIELLHMLQSERFRNSQLLDERKNGR